MPAGARTHPLINTSKPMSFTTTTGPREHATGAHSARHLPPQSQPAEPLAAIPSYASTSRNRPVGGGLPMVEQSGHHVDVTAPGVKQQHVTNRRADRPALHPCRHGHLGAGASGLVIARPARPRWPPRPRRALTIFQGATGPWHLPRLALNSGLSPWSSRDVLLANLATQRVVCGTTSRPIRPEPWFPATAGRMRLYPGLPSTEGTRRRHRTVGASLDFANSRAAAPASPARAVASAAADLSAAADEDQRCRAAAASHSCDIGWAVGLGG